MFTFIQKTKKKINKTQKKDDFYQRSSFFEIIEYNHIYKNNHSMRQIKNNEDKGENRDVLFRV
jgi:hypothetical protein